jgi:CRISPR-associated protein Cas2
MWLFALFDLPVDTVAARREYARFRKLLLSNGFCMLQYSVYARACASEESGQIIRERVKAGLPDDGQVRLLLVTDVQFAKQEVFLGKARREAERAPDPMLFF